MVLKSLLIVYSNLNPGGIPAKIIDIVNSTTDREPKIRITIILHKGHPNDLRSLITNPRVTIKDWKFPHIPGSRLFFIFRVWWEILTCKPVSVLAFISPYALPVLAAKKLFFWEKLRVIVSEDHYTQTLLPRMAYPSIQKLGIKLLYPLADKVIVPTRALKQQLEDISNVRGNKITVVPNWTRFSDLPLPKTDREYDIAHLGRLVPSKHPLRVIRIMHEYIKSSQAKVRCVIAGDGSEAEKIRTYIGRYGLEKNITLLPSQKNVSTILMKSKTFLFLPEPAAEGFPIILLDAMACGCLVITTSFKGAGEVISHSSDGFVEDTINGVLNHIHQAVDKRAIREKLTRQAKNLVGNRFSLKNAHRYVSLMYGNQYFPN